MLRLLLGNDPLFQVAQYQLVDPWEFGVYAVLGIAGGFVSAIFTKILLRMRERFLRLPRKTLWFQPVVGGLLVGVMGWFVPQLLGVGYAHVGQALNGGIALKLMILLLVLKLLSVTTSYASGNAGGIFGPSLFIGAMLGGIGGHAAQSLWPSHVAAPGAYALVGMGTVFAGVVRAPMTSVVMIFEITRDYTVIVPLMISNLVSLFISSRLQRKPIYEALAGQDGIHLPSAEARQQHTQRQVVDIMRTATDVLLSQMTIQEALEHVRSSPSSAWPVTDGQGVAGVIGLHALQRALADGGTAKRLSELLDAQNFPHVHPDQSFHLTLERMGAAKLDVLPVVSRADVHKLQGIVTLQDVLNSYGVGSR